MRLRQLAMVSCLAGCLLTATACGSGGAVPAAGPTAAREMATSCAAGSGFALSLVSDRGGRPTPVAAARWFGRHGGVAGVPARGWREIGRNGGGVTVRSGSFTLHVIQGRDRSWQVDSGQRCP